MPELSHKNLMDEFLEQMILSCDILEHDANNIESKHKRLFMGQLPEYAKAMRNHLQTLRNGISGQQDARKAIFGVELNVYNNQDVNDSIDFIREYLLCSTYDHKIASKKEFNSILDKSNPNDGLKLDYLKLL